MPFERDSRGLMSRSHLDAPDETPEERRTAAIEHYLEEASWEVIGWLRRGSVADLEELYRRLDGDDAESLWKSLKREHTADAVVILARARAEQRAEEAMQ